MNCSPNISIALSLLALTAGVWFLYKTQKENLGILYKVAAWFIIIATLLNMACCGMRCCMRACMMRGGMEQCEMGMGECGMGHGGFNKRVMIFRGGEEECEMGGGKCCKEGRGECEEGKGECEEGKGECKEGKMDCCKKGEKKCDMKMDSVVKKK